MPDFGCHNWGYTVYPSPTTLASLLQIPHQKLTLIFSNTCKIIQNNKQRWQVLIISSKSPLLVIVSSGVSCDFLYIYYFFCILFYFLEIIHWNNVAEKMVCLLPLIPWLGDVLFEMAWAVALLSCTELCCGETVPKIPSFDAQFTLYGNTTSLCVLWFAGVMNTSVTERRYIEGHTDVTLTSHWNASDSTSNVLCNPKTATPHPTPEKNERKNVKIVRSIDCLK